MPYTDYNQVLQDIADNIREANRTTASIRFVDMPDLISSFIGLNVSVTSGTYSTPRPWREKLIPYIGSTSGMTDMSHMLEHIDLRNYSLDLSQFDTSDVTNMAHMFDEVRTSSLDLSSFDTSNVKDMSYILKETRFYSDVDLDLSHFDTSKVTNLHYAFFKLGSSASTASVALNVAGWDVSKVTDFAACFALDAYHPTDNPLSSITELDLSGWDTSRATNMISMFSYSRIRKMWLPSTFVGTGCPDLYKPFAGEPTQVTCHVYTNASSASGMGWGGTGSTNCVFHFNSTHADYENA